MTHVRDNILAKYGVPTPAPDTGVGMESEEMTLWRKQRLGMITCSQFSKLPKTGKMTQTAQSYLNQLLAERITDTPQDMFTSAATDWGIEHEAEAIRKYEEESGLTVSECGFILYEEMKYVGGTPDGCIYLSNPVRDETGCIEVKCPYKTANHIATLVSEEVPDQYKDQVTGHMLLTGASWCDFISYDPRCTGKELVIVRVMRDEEEIQKLRARLQFFEEQLEAHIVRLR